MTHSSTDESACRRVTDWIVDRPSVDLLAAAVIVAGYALVALHFGHGAVLSWLTTDARATLYSTGATVVSVLGGLAAIATAVYQSAEGRRASAARTLYRDQLRRNWRAVLTATGVSALLCIVSLVMNREPTEVAATLVFGFGVALWTLRFARLIYLFDRLLSLADHDLSDVPVAEAPPFNPDWAAGRRRAS